MTPSTSEQPAGQFPLAKMHIVAGAVMCLLSILVWGQLKKIDRESIANLTHNELQNFVFVTESAVKQQTTILERLSQRWEMRGGTPEHEFRADAQNYVADEPGLFGVAWADKEFVARWVVPRQVADQIQQQTLAFNEPMTRALIGARDNKTTTLTAPVSLRIGGFGFAVFTPIFVDDQFHGLIGGGYHYDRFFKNLAPKSIKDGFSFEITQDGAPLYEHTHDINPASSPYRQSATVSALGNSWNIAIWPSPSLVRELRSPWPDLVLVACLLFTVLLVIALRIGAGLQHYLNLIQIQNEQLALEINERTQAEHRAAELNNALEAHSKELEAANKELAAFSYSVSHDLRAPLRSMEGFSRALVEDCNDQLDDTGRDYLDRIRKASRRMNDLIEAILSLSRSTQGELKRRPIDLSEMARSIINELQSSDPERAVEVIIEDGINAVGDDRMLRVMLENLIGNAWKYTSKCELPKIEFGKLEENNVKTYFVRDNGAGFDMTYADRLFTPFQRLHKKQDFEGTGIGLASVRRIINRHGGEIWAESQPDEGATFYFTMDSKEHFL